MKNNKITSQSFSDQKGIDLSRYSTDFDCGFEDDGEEDFPDFDSNYDGSIQNDDWPSFNENIPSYPQAQESGKKGCGSIICIVLIILILLSAASLGAVNVIRRYQEITIPGEEESSQVSEDDSQTDWTVSEATTSVDHSWEEESFYYYYHHMTETEKTYYNQMLNGIRRFESEIVVNDLKEEEMDSILKMLFKDHPELFWCDMSYRYAVSGDEITLKMNYTYDEQEVDQLQSQINQKISNILGQMQSADSQYDKAKLAFDYIIDAVEYDTSAKDNQNIISSLLRDRSVCAGYAKGMQYLLQKSGVQTIYVNGTANDGPHGWLIVSIDGDYYHIDPTFGDVEFQDMSNIDTMPVELRRDYSYLCMSDEDNQKNHQASEEAYPLPSCQSDTLSYYRKNQCYFDHWSPDAKDYISNKVRSGVTYYDIRFSSKEAYDRALLKCRGHFEESIQNLATSSKLIKMYFTNNDNYYVIKGWYE